MQYNSRKKLILLALVGFHYEANASECEDQVYTGTDTSISNFDCMDKCEAGETDAECVSAPAVIDGGSTQVGPAQACYNKYIYGLAISGITPGMVLDAATPAICQGMCQTDMYCVGWQWEYQTSGENKCVLKSQGTLDGAVNASFVTGTETYDGTTCNAAIGQACLAGIYDCLTCDGTYRCAYASYNAYTGWKYCGIEIDPCTARPVDGDTTTGKAAEETTVAVEIPKECLDAIYLGTDQSVTNRYCMQKCANNGGLDSSDTECVLQPAVVPNGSGTVQIPPGNYFAKYVYGMDGTHTGGSITETPALCQELCQSSGDCVGWLWHYHGEGENQCVQKLQQRIDGALNISFETEGQAYDNNECAPGIDSLCLNHIYQCLSCDGTYRCVYEMANALSGWKYSGIPHDACSTSSATRSSASRSAHKNHPHSAKKASRKHTDRLLNSDRYFHSNRGRMMKNADTKTTEQPSLKSRALQDRTKSVGSNAISAISTRIHPRSLRSSKTSKGRMRSAATVRK